jgi:hypothetical protein
MTRLEISTHILQGLLASGDFTEGNTGDHPWFIIDAYALNESPVIAVTAALRITDALIKQEGETRQ